MANSLSMLCYSPLALFGPNSALQLFFVPQFSFLPPIVSKAFSGFLAYLILNIAATLHFWVFCLTTLVYHNADHC